MFFAIIHAGWRGLVNGIVSQTVRLIELNNISKKNIEVIVGPSIQSCCFEVSEDIIDKFEKDFIRKKNNAKYSVNLQKILENKLKNYGFLSKNISILNECTFCKKNQYFSYRREGNKTGRMFGLIGAR